MRMLAAGFLAAYAVVIELQAAPVSLILGLYLVFQCATRERRFDDLAAFGIGGVIPVFLMLGYNELAFRSPWDFGYPHHTDPESPKCAVRSTPGPGVSGVVLGKGLEPAVGPFRGLLFYAPILLLTVPGWGVLLARRSSSIAAMTMLVVAAVLLVNVFYPEWSGGWSTGPRLLVPLLPFAVLPIAGLLAGESAGARWRRGWRSCWPWRAAP